jgi:Phage tail tube protein, GTA-gp10
MANRHRGEIEATLDGRPWTLCLTLGALAELEAALAAGDLMGLAARFQAGRLSASDAIRILGAGLRGAGNDIEDGAVARMKAEGGATGFVAIVGELLVATFGSGEAASDPSQG